MTILAKNMANSMYVFGPQWRQIWGIGEVRQLNSSYQASTSPMDLLSRVSFEADRRLLQALANSRPMAVSQLFRRLNSGSWSRRFKRLMATRMVCSTT